MAAAKEEVFNVYEENTLQINVGGEEAVDVLKGKLCEQGLKMIEVYADWSGPCKSYVPLLKRMKLEKEPEQSCFVALICKAETHELLADYNGMSMPHFLFYRNGVLKATVKGANVPQLESLINEWTPTSADADDLEENPMFIKRKEEQAAAAEAAAASAGA